jgi:hypothetical protein
MIQLIDFKERREHHDRVVQMALREIDSSALSRAAVAMNDEEREIVYRNMSKRACALLAEDVARDEQTISKHAASKAKEFFLQKLRKYREYIARRPPPEHPPTAPPALDTSSEEALIESFTELVRFARSRGNLALEDANLSNAEAIARRGVELVVDGWDPILIRDILTRMKETYLAAEERRIEMIIEGVDSLVSEDVPLVAEERLRAFLPPNAPATQRSET